MYQQILTTNVEKMYGISKENLYFDIGSERVEYKLQRQICECD